MEVNQIYNEDCRDTMKKIPPVDLVVTSPPYDNLRTYEGCEWNFDIFKEVAQGLWNVVKEGGVIVWVVGDATIKGSETGTSFKQALYFKELGFNLHDTMIYYTSKPPLTHNRYEQMFEYMFVFSKGKPNTFNPIMARKNTIQKSREKAWRREKDGTHDRGFVSERSDKIIDNVWYIESGNFDDKTSYQHPATFPEQLAKDHIYSWSNEGDLVYDPFGGSGTVAKCAHLMKRNWILSELSEKYCTLAQKRIEPYLMQQTLF